MQLNHMTWVVVADGGKYMLLHNAGDEKFLDLRVIRKSEIDTPPARGLSSDRPGRMPGAVHGQSALEETDWHIVEKRRFASELATKLEGWSAKQRFEKLVVIADPRTLGELRNAYGDKLEGKLVAEIGKDLTNLPVPEIESVLGQL
jgi:protein required for attachment to host cells